MDNRHDSDDGSDAAVGGGALSRGAVTVRGPLAWLVLAVMAFPWGVGMYVIARAVAAYLSRPAQPVGSAPPPRFSQRAAAYRRWEEE